MFIMVFLKIFSYNMISYTVNMNLIFNYRNIRI